VRREGEGGAGSKLVEKAKPDPYVELTPDQRYVAELKDLGRVKLAARAESGQDDQWLHAAQPARLYQGFSCRKTCPETIVL